MSAPSRSGAAGARARLFELLFRIDHAYGRLRRRVRGWLGIQRRLAIVPFRGYGTPERACVMLRVQEDRGVEVSPTEPLGLVGSAIASYKRYATVEIPEARVLLAWAELVEEHVGDEEGFVEAWMRPPATDARGGDRIVEVEVLSPRDEPPVRGRATVQVVPPGARFGVISDIDDTVIETGVPNLFRRAAALFLTDSRLRLPFEGVGAFYSALRDGLAGDEGNPIFYVSSSPWNLYRHLEDLLERHDIPPGPLLLRDWGLSRHGFAPGGGHGHKRAKMEGIFEALPELSFLLIGDSGQEDAAHYTEMVRRHPGRVLAVYIRSVSAGPERARRIEQLVEECAGMGVEMLLVEDTVSAARHAASRGWIPEEAVARTRAGERADLRAPDPVESALSRDPEG